MVLRNGVTVGGVQPPRDGGRGTGPMRWRPALAVLGTVLAAWGYGAWRIRTLPLRELGTVGLVQPNEGFREKWDPGHADSVVAKLVDLSRDRKSTRLNSSHGYISYAVFCLK